MKERKEYKPSKSVSIITQNKKRVTGIIIGLYLGVELLLCYLLKADLENAYYISQLLGGLVVVVGLVVSVLQYTATNIDNLVLRDKEKKIKAAEMANEFQGEIIPLSGTLTSAYKYSGMDKRILSKIEQEKFEMFDAEEVAEILRKTNIDIDTIFKGLCIGHLIAIGEIKDVKMLQKGEEKLSQELQRKAEKEMNYCIYTLGNKLEYFGICFNSGIADDDTVYQSLHSVFFDCVHMLFLFLFSSNISESDRLFSNISSLYTKWHDRYEKLVEEENEERKNLRKGVQEKIVVKSKK